MVLSIYSCILSEATDPLLPIAATVHNLAQTAEIVDSLGSIALPMRVHTLTAAVADVYIAISFSFILHGKRTGFYGTNHIITRLVLYIIH